MRILLTNDDGFDAAGLQNLYNLLAQFDFIKEVWIVAPNSDKSCSSHSMSFQKHITLNKKAERKFIVMGTPVDCVIVAVHDLMKTCKPDMIISGINMGANVDIDVMYSGTVAAAREGSLLGIPAIAISQLYYKKEKTEWQHEDAIFSKLLAKLILSYQDKQIFRKKSLLNINLPAKPILGIKYLAQGSHHFGNYIEIINNQNDEIAYSIGTNKIKIKADHLNSGYIMVTPLGIDLTDHEVLDHLHKI